MYWVLQYNIYRTNVLQCGCIEFYRYILILNTRYTNQTLRAFNNVKYVKRRTQLTSLAISITNTILRLQIYRYVILVQCLLTVNRIHTI